MLCEKNTGYTDGLTEQRAAGVGQRGGPRTEGAGSGGAAGAGGGVFGGGLFGVRAGGLLVGAGVAVRSERGGAAERG